VQLSPANYVFQTNLQINVLLNALEILVLTQVTEIEKQYHSAQWMTVEIQLVGSFYRIFDNSKTNN